MNTSGMHIARRLVTTLLVFAVLGVILNDVARYGYAWSQVMLSVRDSTEAMLPVVKSSPADRDSAGLIAAQQCSRRGVELTAYDQQVINGLVGRTVTAGLYVRRPVRGTIILSRIPGLLATAGGLPAVEFYAQHDFGVSE